MATMKEEAQKRVQRSKVKLYREVIKHSPNVFVTRYTDRNNVVLECDKHDWEHYTRSADIRAKMKTCRNLCPICNKSR